MLKSIASNVQSISVPYPTPTISSIDPTEVDTGGDAFTLTVNGTNFFPVSVVRVNGSPRSTTYVSSILLQATITAEDIATDAVLDIDVLNPPDLVSNEETLTASSGPPLTDHTVSATNTPGNNVGFAIEMFGEIMYLECGRVNILGGSTASNITMDGVDYTSAGESIGFSTTSGSYSGTGKRLAFDYFPPLTGNFSDYEVRCTVTSGNSPGDGASTGTWLSLTDGVTQATRRSWFSSATSGTIGGVWTIEVRDSDENVVATSAVTWSLKIT